MGKFLDDVCADVRQRWLRLVQGLNGVAVAIAGGALVVNQSYPDTLKSLVAGLPVKYQLGALFLFGAVVHFGLQRAAKAPKP